MPVLSKSFAQVIKNLRTERGFSQELLAEKSGLHPTYISLIERGLRNPTLDVSKAIATALGLSLSDMVGQAEALQTKR